MESVPDEKTGNQPVFTGFSIELNYMRRILTLAFIVISAFCSNAQLLPEKNEYTILQNVNIIDVTNGNISKKMDIAITGGIITQISKHKTDWDKDLKRIDLKGKYIIPGLIEGHCHITGRPEKSLTIALKRGVTAIRDMGGDGAYLKELRDAILNREVSAPDIYFSAIMGGAELILSDKRVKLSTPPSYQLGEAPWARLVTDTSNIRQIISDVKSCGATGIKIYSKLSAAICKSLAEEAKKQEMKVWAHAAVIPATVEEVINAGVEVVSHVPFLLYKEGWDLQKDGSTAYEPNSVYAERFKNIIKLMQEKNTSLDPTLSIFISSLTPIMNGKLAEELESTLFKAVKIAHHNGVKIVAGTDCPLPLEDSEQLMLHREIEMLAEDVGLLPYEALQAATINNAEILGIEKTNGTIEVGKTANLVALKKNPLKNIHNIERVFMVIKDGIIIN